MAESKKPEEEYVVVRHRPGHRLRRSLILLLFSVVCGALGYIAGVSQGEFPLSQRLEIRERPDDQSSALRERYSEARQRLLQLERSQVIDQQALRQARRTISSLETTIAALRADLTFYRNIMAPSESNRGLQVDSLVLKPTRNDDEYRFKLVLIQVGDNESYISGFTTVNIMGERDGKEVLIPLRDVSGDISDQNIRLRYRYFQNIEGTLSLPRNFQPHEIQVVAKSEGAKATVVERSYDWDQLTENGP